MLADVADAIHEHARWQAPAPDGSTLCDRNLAANDGQPARFLVGQYALHGRLLGAPVRAHVRLRPLLGVLVLGLARLLLGIA